MANIVTPEMILSAYTQGAFPMAEGSEGINIDWCMPQKRGQLSIPDLHIPRSLKKVLKKQPYKVMINHAFDRVIEACAAQDSTRPETWINQEIMDVFCQLHQLGYAHSVECWEGSRLVGGLYGLAIGKVFCGESMFSREKNASKIALVHLVARLYAGGFEILDTQFTNDHLQQFGVYEIEHEEYVARLLNTLAEPADFLLRGRDQECLLKRYLEKG